MAWFYLLIAAFLEIGWPFGLKMSQVSPQNKLAWILFGVVSMAGSGYFLWLSQKIIPMGTAYAIWTGIGMIGAFLLGIIYFSDSASLARIVFATFIVVGVIGLKLSS